MLDRLFGTKVHYYVYIFSLVVLAIGMPFGKAIQSLGFVLLIANFLLEFNFIDSFKRLKENIPFISLLLFFTFLILSIAWSLDPLQGLLDVKSRLPMVAIPIIVLGKTPLSKKELFLVLHIFLASMVASSLYNFLGYHNVFNDTPYIDIRQMSHFGSHIRYGLLIALGVSVTIYYQLLNKKINFIYLLIIGWLLFYTYFSQILSGYLAVTMVIISFGFYMLWKWNKIVASVSLLAQLAFLGFVTIQFLNFEKKPADLDSLPAQSVQGNFYYHTNEEFSEINGLPIYTFYVPSELKREWNKVSKIDVNSKDRKNHVLVSTLLRYMTVLEITKDSLGFQELSKQDIKNIENGYTYPNEANQPFRSRINGVRYQLINDVNINGHSLLQRFEYWKTSIFLIKKFGILGVGLGGNQQAFDQAYIETNSKLKKELRCRSHNMFFSVLIGQGIIGLVLFLSMLFILFRTSIKLNFFLGMQFFAVLIPSFLIEDTLETQLGVTMFGFFVALILSEYKRLKISAN
jgi:hypothetical protein